MPYDSICAFVDLDRDPSAVLDAVSAVAGAETIVHLVTGVPSPGDGNDPEVHHRLRASAEARLRGHADGVPWMDETPEVVLVVVDGGAVAAAEYAAGKSCELLILDARLDQPDCTLSVLLAR